MSGSSKITVGSKNNISDEKLEITVKTFFGYEITVRLGGNYEVLTGGIKGLIDKILWFLFAPTLESRKAAVQKTLENNNSQVPNEKTKSNNGDEQNSPKTSTTSDYLNKTNQFLGEKKSEDDAKKSENSSSERLEQSKNSKNIELDNNAHEESSPKIDYNNNIKIVDDPDDSNSQLLSNEKDNIGNQTNINNDIRNNIFIKERESEKQINDEISENSDHRLRNNEFIKKDNDIISENLQSKDHIDDPNKEKTFDDLVNSAIEQKGNEYKLSKEECNEIKKGMSAFKGNEFTENGIISVVKDMIIQLREESLYSPHNKNNKPEQYSDSNERDDIRYQTNINNGIKNNNSIEISAADNDFSIFNDENNAINSDGENQNSARTDVNNMVHDSSDLSEQELKDLDKEIKDLRLQENEVQFYKESRIAEIKKDKKEKAEEQQQLERIAKQSKSENENIKKRYKEVEDNLKKIIPEGYRVTSSERGDKIKGDGNCFYRAIAKLKNGNQEEYGEIRTTISGEIETSAELVGKSDYKIDDNLLHILQIYAGEYNELKDVEVAENNLAMVLSQIEKYVKGEDKKNEYAGPIEAYFYAKATKKVVIIYDSNDQISVFIPDKDGNNVHVEHMAPDKIENCIKRNNINVANAVKLAYNTFGKHYEAIVPVDVKN